MSKVGKKLIKGVKEAIKEAKDTKEKKFPGRLVCDGKNWIAEDGTKFKTIDEMLDHDRKLAKAKFRKLPAEKRKAIKEKEKKQRLKWKEQDRKNEIKWANQRAKRGYSDNWCWSIDHTLLKLIPDMVEHMLKNKTGWQPQLGYKYDKKLKKVVKLKKQKIKDKHSGKNIMAYPDITYKEEQEVLKYLVKGFRQLYTYHCDDDKDYDKINKLPKKEWYKFYKDRQKKIDALHNEVFKIFTDIFYSLWD